MLLPMRKEILAGNKYPQARMLLIGYMKKELEDIGKNLS
jgi:hypothetical protein